MNLLSVIVSHLEGIKSIARPLLVKLARACDVQLILANRRKLSHMPKVLIKPDLVPNEHVTESPAEGTSFSY